MSFEFPHPDVFVRRHVGPGAEEVGQMVAALGAASLDEVVDAAVPRSIRLGGDGTLRFERPMSESELLDRSARLAAKNRIFRSLLGMGFSDCVTPPVILRNVLENPGWYTQYTPYQAEIAQGRLEALLNFQTMVIDLTGFEVANASLLDEATACAEAMTMLFGVADHDRSRVFFVSERCHPQNVDVVRTRAWPLGIEVVVGDESAWDFSRSTFGVLVQYPTTDGALVDHRALCERAHAAGARVVFAADLLALALVTPPAEIGADVAVGNTQRFGVPLGYGGPHAAFFATKSEFVRKMPGRIIGVSQDVHGRQALRMSLQTREQHIRREKATSNICTAQVLLAAVAGMYAVYHGPTGIRAIAERVHRLASALAAGLTRAGRRVRHAAFFDTVRVEGTADEVRAWHAAAAARQMNFRAIDDRSIGISLDETTSAADVEEILACFGGAKIPDAADARIPEGLRRTSAYLTHPVFGQHHSETEMLRYLRKLELRDLSLAHSMIPLGSCTMKLNATAEMIPVTWPQWGRIHPFAPVEQAAGYREIFSELESMLAEITGFAAVSLQPNAGSQGEYAGLLVIRRHHESRGEGHRDVCLIPSSAHGTNPASAVMAGLSVVVVLCDEHGNVDVADLEKKAAEHAGRLAALMVTYPSTHGVFEEEIRKICEVVHRHGGQVYMDGANLNAQVGLCRPGDFGADVCHINLHKTFCIPHGGGGPGMGPICVAKHLAPFLPGHPVVQTGGAQAIGAVSASPWGSSSILLISWAYMKMMGGEGLTHATKIAILSANYVAKRLDEHFPVFYRGKTGRVAHECILDMRKFKKTAGIEVEDIAKRLMDYGFHAPTMSFPIPSTMMIEPTESEPLEELDRFCEAMIAIRAEIREVEEGRASREDNVLKHAPHTAEAVVSDAWSHAYPREKAAFPLPWVRGHKFWPSVGRVNNVLGDRQLVCACV